MDGKAQYSTNPPSSTISTHISPSFPSSNITTSQQNMDPSQINNVHLSNNSGQPFPFPSPPYNPMHTIPLMNQTHQGYSSSPVGQSRVPSITPNTQKVQDQREDDRKKMEAKRCKIAREQRKQIIQRLRSKHGSKATTSMRPPIHREIQETIPHVFLTRDGKRFEEILTKKLRHSDISNYGRIVLPKKEAEEKLPSPTKEGIDVVFKDIYSGLEWKLKFKYWINGKTRMYVLDNTADLVKHYKLCEGDYLSFYGDEFKNLYLYTKKACELPTLRLFPCADQDKEKESSNSTSQQIHPTSGLELHPSDQMVGEETNNTETSSILEQTIPVDGDGGGGDNGGGDDDDGGADGGGDGGDDGSGDDADQQNSLDKFYESLEDIFDVNWRQ